MRYLLPLIFTYFAFLPFAAAQTDSTLTEAGRRAVMLASSPDDTLFLDYDFEPTERGLAAIYRTPITQEGDRYRFTSYFINHQKQVDGLSSNRDSLIWDGEVFWYQENGNPIGSRSHKAGILHGPSKEYDTWGRHISTVNFKKGVPHGPIEVVNLYKGNLKDGKKDGLWELYHPDGSIKQQYTLVEGKLDGEFNAFHSNGPRQAYGQFEKGKMINFEADIEMNYCTYRIRGAREGEIEKWQVLYNEQPILEYFFKGNKRIGTWKMYAESNGALFREATYLPDCQPDRDESQPEPAPGKLPQPNYELPRRFESIPDITENKGCVNGTYTEYDAKGKIHYQAEYKTGTREGTPILTDYNKVELIPHPLKKSCLAQSEESGTPKPLGPRYLLEDPSKSCFEKIYAKLDTVVYRLPLEEIPAAYQNAIPKRNQCIIFLDSDPYSGEAMFKFGDKARKVLARRDRVDIELGMCISDCFPKRDWVMMPLWETLQKELGIQEDE